MAIHDLPHQWHGAGEPLVLIAGLGSKGTSWKPFLEAAASRFRVLTFDLPGVGESAPLAEGTTLREMAERIAGWLARLGLRGVRIVGRSMGGMLAQEIVLRSPELASRLVLVSTSGRVDPHLASVFRLWARMADEGVSAGIRHQSSMLWCLGSQSLADEERVRAYLSAKSRTDRPADYAIQARACAEHDALERLAALRIPVLVVSGTDDRLTPPAHAEALAKAIPEARLLHVPGAGHLPYLECPETFSRLVLDFLAEQEPTP